MSTDMVGRDERAEIMERVIALGDLAKLESADRVKYYGAVCESLGLNPLTKPFDYIILNNKLVLYATKGCADQLRDVHHISLGKPSIQFQDGLVVVSIDATDDHGRTDSDLGAVALGNLTGDARANAIMKAITKAKRRVTLSICGLGMLDETEVGSIPGVIVPPPGTVIDHETGEILEQVQKATPDLALLERHEPLLPFAETIAKYKRGMVEITKSELDPTKYDLPADATEAQMQAMLEVMRADIRAAMGPLQ